MKLLIFVGILQVLRFDFQKFRFLKILNFHIWISDYFQPPFNFLLVFNDVHLFAVIFSVVVINYVFQDGKSDYFQGNILYTPVFNPLYTNGFFLLV